jgi:hypothetical protein
VGFVVQLDSALVGPAFAESKAFVCCTAAGTAGNQWVAVLAAGAFIVFTAVCVSIFILKMDRLPPKKYVSPRNEIFGQQAQRNWWIFIYIFFKN